MEYDLLIAGAGPVGCVVAERAASVMGWTSLVVDKRKHIAGNCYDRLHSDVLVHEYGPHYFRTDSDDLLSYLSKFTDWIPGNYVVKSSVAGKLYPFPINRTTLELYFGRTFSSEEEVRLFLETRRVPIRNPQNSEEFVLSRVGREMYEDFYLGYTKKQWGLHPRELSPEVCGRIPIRFNRYDKYVNQKHQLTPRYGFTEMFRNMLRHQAITVMTKTDFFDIKGAIVPRIATVYTGPIDRYFDLRFGELSWRSLDFEFKEFFRPFSQECVQINHPNEFEYTRSVEIKHITAQYCKNTVVSYEYPSSEGDPYYPIPNESNKTSFHKYKVLAQREQKEKCVYFSGRLASYSYINTDEAIEMALATFEEIRTDFLRKTGKARACMDGNYTSVTS